MTTLSKLHEIHCGQELSSEEAREIKSIVRNEQYIDMTFILNRHCALFHQAFPTANRMSIQSAHNEFLYMIDDFIFLIAK